MGTDKALLALDGQKFIERIAGELSAFEERIIARGNNSNLPDIDWKIIPDQYPDHGPLGGIHAALSACEADALFFVTCDMPFIQYSLAKLFCCAFTENLENGTALDAVVAVTPDERIHPLCGIYTKSALPVLEKQLLADQNKVMMALKQMNVDYLQIPSDMSIQCSNINTRDDYEKIKTITEKTSGA
ncbi:MAG: molybdenum cofactor guanylyltransferase [Lachnospiraceae bacterium]|nr:molybdenum cofactor guanylyltransferase [Lachnospiraceae bacterium]